MAIPKTHLLSLSSMEKSLPSLLSTFSNIRILPPPVHKCQKEQKVFEKEGISHTHCVWCVAQQSFTAKDPSLCLCLPCCSPKKKGAGKTILDCVYGTWVPKLQALKKWLHFSSRIDRKIQENQIF